MDPGASDTPSAMTVVSSSCSLADGKGLLLDTERPRICVGSRNDTEGIATSTIGLSM